MKVGFFDSGYGGLSVLSEALDRFDGEFYYFADTKNVPYGTKSIDEIINLSIDACQFLINLGIEALVVACNTATSASISVLREKFKLPIIGMEPAIKTALEKFKGEKTLLIATPATIHGKKLENLINRLNAKDLVSTLELPQLVKFAENLEFDTDEVRKYLMQNLSNFNLLEYKSLVLGCTHFNYFNDILREILPENIYFIDGIKGTLNRLEALNLKKETKKNVKFFNSKQEADKIEYKKITKMLERLEKVKNLR